MKPTHTCPMCGEGFSAAGAVRNHAWEAHTACHYCGEQFENDDDEVLFRHWLASHPGELTRADSNRAEAAVDSLTFTDRLEYGGIGTAVAGISRRRLLFAVGAATIAGLAVGSTVLDRGDSAGGPGSGAPTDSTGGSGGVANAPVPAAPDEYRYAMTATADSAPVVTYFGSWKCPYCAQFSTGFLAQIVTDYVQPGEIALEFRDLAYINGEPFLGPDAPAAGRAGLAVWNTDPDSYWPYHEYVFRNQPPESDRWATADNLVAFARESGVSDPGAVRTAVQENEYEDSLQATTDAATGVGIQGTPTLVVNGTTVSPFDEEKTRRLIGDAVG